MNQQELTDRIYQHAEWLRDPAKGEQFTARGRRLSDLDFSNADLSHAVVHHCCLNGSTFRNARLRAAQLMCCNLEGVDFSVADMTSADCYESWLRYCILKDADLDGLALRKASGIIAIGPIGSRGDITLAVDHFCGDIMVKCGCFWGSFDEWRTHCEEEYACDNPHGIAYRAAVHMIKAHASAYWR